jgi:hypothetical protein
VRIAQTEKPTKTDLDAFAQVPYALAGYEGLKAWDILVYARIAGYKKDAYPSYEYLAKFARCSRRSAIRAVKKLEKLKLLRVERRPDATCNFEALRPWIRKQGVTTSHLNRKGLYKASPFPQQQRQTKTAKAATAEQAVPAISWGDSQSLPAEVAA